MTWSIFSDVVCPFLNCSRSLVTRMCFFPPLVTAPIARLTDLTVGDCPIQSMWSPWDTARAVRRWSPQDQGSYAMGFDTQRGSASAQPCADSSGTNSVSCCHGR